MNQGCSNCRNARTQRSMAQPGKAVPPPRAWPCSIQLPAKTPQSLPIDNKSNTDKHIHHLPFVDLQVVQKMTLFSQIKALPSNPRIRNKDVWASPKVNGAETTGMAGNNTWRNFFHPDLSSDSVHEVSLPCTQPRTAPGSQHQQEVLPLNCCLQTLFKVEFVSATERSS